MINLNSSSKWDGEGNGNSLQCSCLGNPRDRGALKAIGHGIAKSQTRLSNKTTMEKIHFLSPSLFFFLIGGGNTMASGIYFYLISGYTYITLTRIFVYYN